MTLGELLKTLPPEKEIDITYYWLPAHSYRYDEVTGAWEYWDGEYWVQPFFAEAVDDPDFDPNDPEIDDEYSFAGTVAEYYDCFVKSYGDFQLEEEVAIKGDGQYEIRRYRYGSA